MNLLELPNELLRLAVANLPAQSTPTIYNCAPSHPGFATEGHPLHALRQIALRRVTCKRFNEVLPRRPTTLRQAPALICADVAGSEGFWTADEYTA
jgi:hypothetical protein